MELRHIIPLPGAVKPYKTPDEHWRRVVEEIYGSSELPQNIHFAHDPAWRTRVVSIQGTRDKITWGLNIFGVPIRIIIGAIEDDLRFWWRF